MRMRRNRNTQMIITRKIKTLKHLSTSSNKDTVLSYLMNMGYDRDEVLDALSAANNVLKLH